ncbi:MAG TPA: NUDIX hydrolase [Thermoanaerobaculia bacterium]|jgi:ADP-ribose pyrophosphatase|nr:NUDIX hydrolase [Thermoanaerobaculia bacterium]
MKGRPDFELLESRTVFEGRVLGLEVDRVRLQNGRVSELEVVRHPGAVAIAPVTADGDVLLVRQFRYATREWLLEVPAGKLDPGEEPEAAAGRELEEETGYRAGYLEPLGWVWTTPGFSNEVIHLYLAHDLEPASQALQDDEVLTVERLPLVEAVERALDGRLHDSKSVCCLLRAARRLTAIGPGKHIPIQL